MFQLTYGHHNANFKRAVFFTADENSEKGVMKMPSDKDKGSAININDAKKHKKKGKSIGWILGVIILIVLSLLLVLPVTAFSGNSSVVFGSYNGENIELSYGNYFFNQVNSLLSSNPQNPLGVYMQAFNATVFKTALDQMAEQVGYRTTDHAIDNAIVNGGLFVNDSGQYDSSLYAALSDVEKAAVRQGIEDTLPAQAVLSDISSVKVSDAEKEYSLSINDTVRDFEYISVDYTSYPDADAIAYAEANPTLFETVGLSMVTAATQEEAKAILDGLNAGTTTFEDAAASSIDPYSSNTGSLGDVFYNEISGYLRNEADGDALFAAEEGTFAGPYQTWYGWSVFRIDSASHAADLENSEILQRVKSYISANDSETMNTYVQSKAEEVYQAASSDFTGAAEANGLEVYTVGPASPNPAMSQFVIGLEMSDANGGLRAATAGDRDYYSLLYSAEEGTVLEPHAAGTNTYVIARPVASTADNGILTSYLDSFYTSFMPQLVSNDLQNAVLGSDLFVNNFFEVYFSNTGN